MSANVKPTAQVYDVAPARVLSLVERQQSADGAATSVSADVADGVEAINLLATLAGYSESVRSFVLALASAAFSLTGAAVALFDEELAELLNCSDRHVRRLRKAYYVEARKLRTVDLVGIEEGEFDRDNNRHAPTRYTFHLAGTVERIVADARRDPRWHDLDRKAQRELLKQAAERAYDLIPDAKRKPRKRKRERLASAVVETHRRAADTHMRKLRDVARRLPETDRERLFDDPGELRAWWLKVRAEMDALCGVESSHSVTSNDLGGVPDKMSGTPPAAEPDAPEPSAEDAAAWEQLTDRLSRTSAIRSVEVGLRPPEYPPGELTYEIDEDELREAEAVRMEACGELREVE